MSGCCENRFLYLVDLSFNNTLIIICRSGLVIFEFVDAQGWGKSKDLVEREAWLTEMVSIKILRV